MIKKVIIFTRGSNNEGWGHIIRGVKLLEYFKKKIYSELYIECDEFVRKKIKKLGGNYKLIDIDSDIKINLSCKDVIIIDRYYYSYSFIKKFFRAEKIIIFDELKKINFENKLRKDDIIIRSQLTDKIKKDKYKCRVLNGIKYFAFKSNLRNITKDIDILIMLGGGNDCLNVYEKMLSEFKNHNLSNLRILLISGGEFYKITEAIKNDFPFLNVKGFVNDVLELMNRSKLAVISGGYCKYEANYFRLPSILVSMKNHQIEISKKYCEETKNIYAGNINDRLIMKKIAKNIYNFFFSKQSFKPKKIIDGKGFDRIFNKIFLCKKE